MTGAPKRKRRGRVPVVVAIVVCTLALSAVVLALVAKRMVATKIAEAAERRALVIDYGGSSLGFGSVGLRDVVIRPKATDQVKVSAPALDARLSGFKPYYLEIPRAEVTMAGSVEDVLASLTEVRKRDAELPAAERIPVDVKAGSVNWTKPVGSKSSFYFGRLVLSIRPKEGWLRAELGTGKIQTPNVTVTPLSVVLERKRDGASLRLTAEVSPSGGGRADLEVTRDDDGDRADLEAKEFALNTLHLSGVALDLERTHLDGKASIARTAEGATSSSGKLSLSHLDLPPMKLGPIQASFGADAKLSWKATPKKGQPGTMILDEGKVEIVIRGKTRVLTFAGEISVGAKGEGPFRFDVRYDLAPIPCAEVAAGVGGLAGQLVAGAVIGNISIKGTAKGGLAELDRTKTTFALSQDCGVEAPAMPTLPKIPW